MEKPIIPTFSLNERDRRWSRLREQMKRGGFDALISLPNEGHWDQFGADTRYITQIGGTQTEVGAVLPLEVKLRRLFAAPMKSNGGRWRRIGFGIFGHRAGPMASR